MLKKDILPAVSSFEGELRSDVLTDEELDLPTEDTYEYETLKQIRKLMKDLFAKMKQTEKDLQNRPEEILEKALYYRNVIVPHMEAMRKDVDALEQITDRRYWPFPTYLELLFGID